MPEAHPPRPPRGAARPRRLAAVLMTCAGALAAPLLRAEPAPLRGIVLQDHRGQTVSPASLDGRVLVLHFVYTTCSATCPTQVKELAAVHDALPEAVRAATRWLSVSVDPLSDTPATLAAFARRLDADRPGWRFATGTPAQVQRLADRMAAFERSGRAPRPEDHRSAIWLYDTRGELVLRLAGAPLDRTRLQREITQLAAPAAAPTADRLALTQRPNVR